jgi:hypothetical protein
MTGKVNIGLNGTDNIDRVCAKSFTLYFFQAKPANISDMFSGNFQKLHHRSLNFHLLQQSLPNHSSNLFEIVPIYLLADTDAQSIKNQGSTDSTCFPPFYYWEQEQSPAPVILT